MSLPEQPFSVRWPWGRPHPKGPSRSPCRESINPARSHSLIRASVRLIPQPEASVRYLTHHESAGVHGSVGVEGSPDALGDRPIRSRLTPDPEAFFPLGWATGEDQ